MIPDDRLKISEDDRGCVVDQYGRATEDCARSATLARIQAAAARTAVDYLRDGSIILGRLGGDRQVQRLSAIADVFDRVVERDERFAEELAEADEIRTRGVHADGDLQGVSAVQGIHSPLEFTTSLRPGAGPR